MTVILVALTLNALTGCGDDSEGSSPDPSAADAGNNDQNDTGSPDDAGSTVDTGRDDDAAADSDECAPAACAPDACGPRPDGCGGVQQCEVGCVCVDDCPCETSADCAARPCEVGTCNDAGTCEYAPLACGGQVCACEGDACEDDQARRCGDGCEALWCDPAPDGEGGYGNVCLPVQELHCGACGISLSECDPDTGQVTCNDLLPVELSEGRQCTELVLFVDPAWDGPERGTRDAPFSNLSAALDLASLANVRMVVIGGGGELQGPVVVRDEVELRGGYTGWPNFRPSTDRPTVRASTNPVSEGNGQLVGIIALDVDRGATIAHLDLMVDDAPTTLSGPVVDATAGIHTIGLMAVDSPALTVLDVDITVGSASDGAVGADAETVSAELPAELMDGKPGLPDPGFASLGSCDEFWDEFLGGFQEQNCTSSIIGDVYPGGRGAPGATCPVDLDGVRSLTYRGGDGGGSGLGCVTANPGTAAPWPSNLIDQRAGSAGGVGGHLDALLRWRTDGNGSAGLPGIGGRPGNGGNGGYYNSCDFASTGGGGGAGGCGGFGGRPGGGGGSSIGVLASRSSGLMLTDVTISIGDGGDGAEGGIGSDGLPGGQGGPAGEPDPTSGEEPSTAGQAGAAGHPGGAGGNGSGGDSVGVLCVDSAFFLDEPDSLTYGEAGAGASGNADANVASAPAGRAAPSLGCCELVEDGSARLLRCDVALGFEQAVHACAAAGGTLPLPADASEAASIQTAAGAGAPLWVALTDREAEGIFVDLEGNSPSYANFPANGEWNADDQDCAVLSPAGSYGVADCGSEQLFVCALP